MSDSLEPAGRRPCATTHWSIVLAAGRPEAPGSAEALAVLCSAYWYPLYAYVRRLGCPPDEARDRTQEFFARLLERQWLRSADPERGRFRSFLLSAFRHFLANEWQRERALKRGGGKVYSLDAAAGEQRYALEPAHEMTAERYFEYRWAVELLQRVLTALRDEFAAAGKVELFDALKGALLGEIGATPYRESAEALGMSEGAVKTAVHRLRRRFAERLRAEIAETVADPADVDDELRRLFAAVGSGRDGA